jgi:hypothetical protein
MDGEGEGKDGAGEATEGTSAAAPPVAVACSLGSEEMRRRREAVLSPIAAAVVEMRALEDGCALGFAPEQPGLAQLAELIDLERRCCPFLRFELTVEPAGGRVWLALTGPSGTREFLASELGLAPPA